jgi:hypothetical protein
MNNGRHEAEEAFYRECARLLDASHIYRPRIGQPNRWNNRHPGNGRFPGFGTIRMHSPGQIHVSLRQPLPVIRTCRSPEEVFRLLRHLMRSAGQHDSRPSM